jgi:hypothetical protein
MLAALPVYGLAALPAGISLLIAAEVAAVAVCGFAAAIRHIERTSRED